MVNDLVQQIAGGRQIIEVTVNIQIYGFILRIIEPTYLRDMVQIETRVAALP